MKKVLFILMLVLASMDVSAQAKPNYYGTHDPSSDSLLTNCHVDIINDHFYIVYIDTIEGKKQEELYTLAKSWVNSYFKYPSQVIVGEVPPSQIVLQCQLYESFYGRIEMKFKDNRWRIDISNIWYKPMSRYIKDKPAEFVPRYEGERGRKWLMADIFPLMNSLKEAISKKTDDNW